MRQPLLGLGIGLPIEEVLAQLQHGIDGQRALRVLRNELAVSRLHCIPIAGGFQARRRAAVRSTGAIAPGRGSGILGCRCLSRKRRVTPRGQVKSLIPARLGRVLADHGLQDGESIGGLTRIEKGAAKLVSRVHLFRASSVLFEELAELRASFFRAIRFQEGKGALVLRLPRKVFSGLRLEHIREPG